MPPTISPEQRQAAAAELIVEHTHEAVPTSQRDIANRANRVVKPRLSKLKRRYYSIEDNEYGEDGAE